MILRLTTPLLFGAVLVAAAACSSSSDDNDGNPDTEKDGGGKTDGGDKADGGGGGGPEAKRVVCPTAIPAASDGELCSVTPGSGSNTMIRATILAGDTIYENGAVVYDHNDPNGKISCVGCDCEAAEATVLECANGVLSPGLINAHDHMPFNAPGSPKGHGENRYNHRHDWRKGKRGNQSIPADKPADAEPAKQFAEMRMLISGVTSLVGSGSAKGLVRNLDDSRADGELNFGQVDYSTFPLGDTDGILNATGCSYGKIEDEKTLNNRIYLPHVAEGIDAEARNEYACMTGGAVNTIAANTSIVHGIGLTAADIADIAQRGAKLVWSPRTNIDLYGQTADVLTYRRLGVNIALGTDWILSGSMNMLRELKCVDSLNKNQYDNAFNDYEIWRMATSNGAVAMGVEDRLGTIAQGYIADLALYDGTNSKDHRAVIDANVDHVALVTRGGSALYGDAKIIEALVEDATIEEKCETLDTCGRSKRVCAKGDTDSTLSTMKTSAKAKYELFYCGEPESEPSCVPFRKGEYDGKSTAGDKDGDGLPDAEDNCSSHFNPKRPLDQNQQPNFDGDEDGDTCDVCPLNEGTTCGSVDTSDTDADGVPNDTDNCPQISNPDQADADNDGIGDVCDACPNEPNAAGEACTATIQDIKNAVVPVGATVRVKNALVVASGKDGVFLQAAGGGNFSGLFAFSRTADGKPVAGDIIDVTGKVSTFNEQIQIEALANITVVSRENAVPAPTVVTPADLAPASARAKELEGTLVRVNEVTAGAFNEQFVELAIDGGVLVDDTLFTYVVPPTGTNLDLVQGPLSFRLGAYRINPRNDSDLVIDAATPRKVATVLPADLTVPPAGTAQITLTLDIAAPAAGTVVNLVASAGVTVPATVTVAGGTRTIQATVTAVAAVGATGTITASVAGQATPVVVNYTIAVPVAACLLISEYVEGNGNNKAFEVYNCGGAPLDLTGYTMCATMRSNATTTASYPLTGTVAQGGVRTFCNAEIEAGLNATCNVTSPNAGLFQFNGNDSLYLVKDEGQGCASPVIDAIGNIEGVAANDPWKDVTYDRCELTSPSLYKGVGAFTPATLYKAYPVQAAAPRTRVTGLGVAPVAGCN